MRADGGRLMAHPGSAATIGDSGGRTVALFALAALALATGLLVYLGDRLPGRAALIPAVDMLTGGGWFGAIGAWLPSFVHPFAFGLLTAAVLRDRRRFALGACATWGAVNMAFEVAQHARLKQAWVEVLHGPLAQVPGLRAVANYGLRGTFDVGDLLAVVLGTLAAVAVLILLDHNREA